MQSGDQHGTSEIELEANPDLKVDPDRACRDNTTGISVRCYGPQGWGPYDIATLTRDSLMQLLRYDGDLAARVVARLLGHP